MAGETQTTLYFGPRYRRTPFFEATLRHGCRAFDIYNHTYLPAYYDDPVKEYWHLLEHVTLWDVGAEHIVEIVGPEAAAFTNLLTCRDLTKCAVWQCKYAPLIAEDGGIVNDPVLWVPIERATPGTAVELEPEPGTRRSARTAGLPFLDPLKRIPAA